MRLALAGTLAAAALLGLARPCPADEDHLGNTPEELEAWRASEDGHYVRARELSEAILRANPRSYAGHYVLGVALHYGEADLARSIFHLKESIRLFEQRQGPEPAMDAPWRWHMAALRELAYSLAEIDHPAEELAILDRFDKAYVPKRLAHRIWPLMKLRRYDDARAAARFAIATTTEERQKRLARGDLCGAEFEAGDRRATYKACTDALADHRSQPRGGQITFSNASEAARSMFRYDEAERLLQESTKRADLDSWGNPFQQLASLYLSEGRIPEAIAALKGGQDLRMRRAAWLDQHGRAHLDQTIASLLLVVGEAARAVDVARRALIRPDRQGTHSEAKQQTVAASAILYALALRADAARLEEEAVSAGLRASLSLRWQALRRHLAAWREERRAATLLADERFLEASLRPYYAGGIALDQWLVAELVRIVGPGVALAAIAGARRAESEAVARVYLDVYEAEAEYRRGHWRAVLELVQRTSAALPKAEALLHGRLAAIGAEAARRSGRSDESTALFSIALTRDPGVLRRVDVRLPVRIEHDSSDVARLGASMIRSSPRFRSSSGGHVVNLESNAAGARACLLGPRHEVIQCAEHPASRNETAHESARRLVGEFHRVAFAVKTDLSQADLTTLDGSPTAGRADRQIRSLLDRLGPNPPPPTEAAR